MNSDFQIHDKHILIVDDNATNILLMQAILEEEGFEYIRGVSSAVEAYEALETEKTDVILMDIVIPGINGLEATKTIKANKKHSNIPIIMVTGVDDDKTLKKSFEFGAIDFIRKPVNQVELIARLKTVLQGQEKDDLLAKHSRYDAIEEIISMLAHQWRQPLSVISSIIGNLQLQKELGSLSDQELDDSLNDIYSHTTNLSEMITNFGKYFKSDARPTLSSPNDSIHEAYSLLKNCLLEQNITVKLDLCELPVISYIQNLLVHVLTTIITNAKDAFEHNRVANPLITVRSSMQGDHVHIIIEDNAGGIPSELIGHIFEPYITTKEERNGKGLGLYFAKNIVTQQLHGNISVESEREKSRFSIYFSEN